MPAVSPLAPAAFPDLPAIDGVRFAAAEAGIKYKNRRDVLLAVFDKGTTVAGVFTQSKCPSAPVEWCKAALPSGKARALLVNSGNANAFTGKRGSEAVKASAAMVADLLGCKPKDVFLASTGVIGEPLDPQKFAAVLGKAAKRAASGPWLDAASAIMTTDTYPKGATRRAEIGGAVVTINGIAKGAGMIAPDMATLLAFVVTDAALPANVLQALLAKGVRGSFNAITVDGDTSTSDTLLMFATGKAGNPKVTAAGDKRLRAFRAALDDLLRDLAHQVVRDGEGARKFVEIRIAGAMSRKSARRIALSVANSPLVKTAIAGEVANWGRVVMAVGKSGEAADRDKLSIWFGEHCVARNGERAEDYDERVVASYMKNSEITIRVDAGVGKGRATVWTCDLTHDYVSINADYRS